MYSLAVDYLAVANIYLSAMLQTGRNCSRPTLLLCAQTGRVHRYRVMPILKRTLQNSHKVYLRISLRSNTSEGGTDAG